MHKFINSEKFLEKVEKLIPLGSQTFSKSKTQYPIGISPLFALRAKGSNLWDIDGNKFIDLVNSLAAITLGYNNKIVNRAVISQVKKGSIFSLPDQIEFRVAELISSLIPSAEMVRFGKNASDATTAAIRLARFYTNRDLVITCGYHGWQDWSIGITTQNNGIPKSVIQNTKSFKFNDIESLKKIFGDYQNQIAAVIIEPINSELPKNGFLEEVLNLTKLNGAISIFDETVTGFRVHKAGAQGLFNLKPDLSIFGKGIANGYPLSVLVGKREIMKEMDKIFFSTTFGGEMVSLSAAEAVLKILIKNDFTKTLADKGKYLSNEIEKLILERGLESRIGFSGHDSWRFINWRENSDYSNAEIRTYFLQEMFELGLLVLNSHNVSCAITKRQLDKVIEIYDDFFDKFEHDLESNNLKQHLKVRPLVPLFKIR